MYEENNIVFFLYKFSIIFLIIKSFKMKYVICYLTVFVLLIPPFLIAILYLIWNVSFSRRENGKWFKKGGNLLHDKFGYGCMIDNLLEF